MAAIYPPGMYRIYVAFSDGPLVASPTWTEITSYWRDLSVSRGRSSELDDFQAGSLTVTLDNRDRRFDPTYSSGPYFSNLLPRRQIKVEAVIGGTTRAVFRGHVASWRQAWSFDDGQQCVVTASDAFALLAARTVPESAHAFVAASLRPTSWWRLSDDGGVVTDAMSRAGGQYGAERTKVDALEASGDGASRTLTAPGEPSGPIARVGYGTNATSTQTVITALVRVDALLAYVDGVVAYDRSFSMVYGDNGGFGTGWVDFGIDYAGNLAVHIRVSGGDLSVASSSEMQPARTHHVAMIRNGTTATIYVDGTSVGTVTNASATGSHSWTKGAVLGDGPTGTTNTSLVALNRDVTLDEVVLWHGSVLTAAQIQSLSDAALGWRLDSAADRIGRILDAIDWPSALRTINASATNVGPFIGGGDALSTMQRTARSEMGRLFVAADGKVVYEPATFDIGASAAAAFADDSTANAIRYAGYELELDDRFTFNIVTVTGSGELTHTSSDATSVSTYGPLALSVETDLPTSAACRDLADRLLARYATPAVRGSSWQIDPVDDTQMLAALALDLGDIVTVRRTPRVGSAHTATVQLVAISHSASSSGTAVITFAGAPADTAARFRWGTSTWGGSDTWR